MSEDLNNTGETSDIFREYSRRRSSAHTSCMSSDVVEEQSANFSEGDQGGRSVGFTRSPVQPSTMLDGSDFGGDDFFYISLREYVPGMIKIGLLIVKENIRRDFVSLLYLSHKYYDDDDQLRQAPLPLLQD